MQASKLNPFFILFLLCACAPPADDPPGSCADGTLVDPDFTTFAGLQVETSTYDLPWDGSERSVAMHFWYRTARTSGEAARYLGFAEDTQSLVGAPYSSPEEQCKHPLIVWSHGSQAWAGQSASILRQFINAGWVAAGPDHTGNTITDNVEPRPPIFDLVRTADVRHTIDWVEALPETHPLHGRIDTSRVLVGGHSYGGQSAWLMTGPTFDSTAIDERCANSPVGCTTEERAAYDAPVIDERVAAVLPMDGSATGLIADDGWAGMRSPVFFMTAGEHNDGTQAFEEADEGDVTWAEIEGACHLSFTDTDTNCDTLDHDEAQEIIARYSLAFGAATIGQSDDGEVLGILDGSISVSERVALRMHGTGE